MNRKLKKEAIQELSHQPKTKIEIEVDSLSTCHLLYQELLRLNYEEDYSFSLDLADDVRLQFDWRDWSPKIYNLIKVLTRNYSQIISVHEVFKNNTKVNISPGFITASTKFKNLIIENLYKLHIPIQTFTQRTNYAEKSITRIIMPNIGIKNVDVTVCEFIEDSSGEELSTKITTLDNLSHESLNHFVINLHRRNLDILVDLIENLDRIDQITGIRLWAILKQNLKYVNAFENRDSL